MDVVANRQTLVQVRNCVPCCSFDNKSTLTLMSQATMLSQFRPNNPITASCLSGNIAQTLDKNVDEIRTDTATVWAATIRFFCDESRVLAAQKILTSTHQTFQGARGSVRRIYRI